MKHQFLLNLFFVLVGIASSQQPVQRLFLENELVLDLASVGSSEEWIIETDPNHIFYFSFIAEGRVIKKHISSSLTIADVNKMDSIIFPASVDNNNNMSPFYSTGNSVSIKLIKPSLLKGLRLKAQKAVPCPFNIGGATSCGRVVDELSCYCALFSGRTWADTRSYCLANNMKFFSIETYEEDSALKTVFAGSENLWIGASDTASEATFVWDSTGEKLSPGYTGWVPGHPYSAGCSGNTSDCVIYHYTHDLLPAWEDYPCSSLYGGICELQPSNSSQSN